MAKICYIILFIGLTLSLSARDRRIDACGVLDQPGVYILQKDVSSPRSCFLVKSDGVTLDLNQHLVIYGTGSDWKPGAETTDHFHAVIGQACWDKGGKADPNFCGDTFASLTVKNGSLIQSEHSPPYSHGIRLGLGKLRSLTVENVNIRIFSPSSVGVMVLGGYGGGTFRNVTVDNHSVFIFNRHQLEGMALRLVDAAKDGAPDRIEAVTINGGPQGGVLASSPGSLIKNSNISLKGAFTNDFAIYLLSDRMEAAKNTIVGRGRGIQVNGGHALVHDNIITTFEEPVNEEYEGCQIGGTYGIQVEARSSGALLSKNHVTARAIDCDARALRVTGTKSNSGNRSMDNFYRATKEPDSRGKAIAASFFAAKEALLHRDTLYADTWNAEIPWDGAQNILLREVTFIKGANAGKDYATFALLPGSNNATYRPTSAEMKVIDPIFRDGASADSFFMHPIGFEKWATPAQYSIQWTYQLTVVGADLPLPGVKVDIVDQNGVTHLSAVTGPEGRTDPIALTEFRRFNTQLGIEKQEFTYRVTLSLGERAREFPLRIKAPLQQVQTLP